MVYPRARGKRSLATFVAVCALLALSVARADLHHDSAALTSEHRTTRSLDANVIIVESEGGSPAILVDDGMQLTSVITVTAVDTPEPIYGTDDNQPTLPPDNDGDDDGSSPPRLGFPDVIETHAPNFEDPLVLIETYAPADTAYWDQRNVFVDDPRVKQLKEKTEQELSDLTLLQVQQVTRHGTRFPTKSTIVAIEKLIEKLQSEYADLIPAWLQSYRLPYNMSVEGALAPPGFTELERFGARTRETIGAALPTAFADDRFILQHTFKSRTKHSALSFAKSFFTNPDDVTYIEYAKNKKDRLLRFVDECPRYISEVSENAEAVAELTAYRESAQIVQNIEVFKTRLNLPPIADITQVDLEAAYSACGFDIAIYNTYSNWCTLLTKDLTVALDYADDLEAFYEKGPGHAINYEIAAVLLKDVYTFMERLLAGDTNVVGNFRFAHAETTLPLMTLLGYGDRTPLRTTYTPDEIAFRSFRSSVLAPLGANIDFRLYESKRDSSKHFVQVLMNEKVAPVPGCGGEVFCELSKVAQLWDYYLTKYDFDADCKL